MHTLEVTNDSLVGLRTQQEGNYTWHWKPGGLPRASEFMDHGEEPATTTLLNQHNL